MKILDSSRLTPKAIFINQIDTFISCYIGKALFNTVFGVSSKEGNLDEYALEEGAETQSPLGFSNLLYCSTLDPSFKPTFDAEIVNEVKWIDLYSKIKTCDYFIYNITNDDNQIDEALWVAGKLHEESREFKRRKVFVLVSTALTWARIKHLPEDDEDAPFTDEDYRRRNAHPNYLRHIVAEKEIKRLGTLDKFKLLTYVISSGVTYGEENDIFHPFFKKGWLNNPSLEVIGPGDNIVPMIHVRDLANIVKQILNLCPTTHYMLAVDGSQSTLLQAVRAISKGLTTGKVTHISIEEAKALEGVTQFHIDCLTLNLRLEATFVQDSLQFRWAYQDGMAGSMANIVKEFKLARGLLPIKICIMGPPLSGKTKLAELLSEFYSLPHITVKEVVDAKIAELEEKVAGLNAKVGDEVDDENGDANMNLQTSKGDEGIEEDDADGAEEMNATELLEEIHEALASTKGQISNELTCRLLKKRLTMSPCINQGYVLDGFPETRAQAKGLLEAPNDEEEEAEEEEADEGGGDEDQSPVDGETGDKAAGDSTTEVIRLEQERAARVRSIPNMTAETAFLGHLAPTSLPKGILPTCVIFLQATDSFLIRRVLHLPVRVLLGMRDGAEGFIRRLQDWRGAHAGAEIASLMENEDLRKALENMQLQKITAGEAGKLIPEEQLASMMAGSIDGHSLYAFFEDKKVPILTFDVMTDKTGEFEEIQRKVRAALGKPRNYGSTRTSFHRVQKQMRLLKERELKDKEEARIQEEQRRREFRKKELVDLMDTIHQEEAKELLKASKPLRDFLSKFIMPTLTKGIFECIWRRPEDPIDYLAEYLFRNNPQID